MSINNHRKETTPHSAGESNNFYPRYLAAKKSIDDRSLNQHVWRNLSQSLQDNYRSAALHILELGAGIGTMFARIIDWGLFSGTVFYGFTDNDPRQLKEAQHYLTQWAAKKNHTLTWPGKQHGLLQTQDAEVTLLLDVVDIENIAHKTYSPSSYDLIIAHALLDLIDYSTVLPTLFSLLKSDGLAYLTCNFNGETLFLPECASDKRIIDLYHNSMEKRQKGASITGKNLLAFFQQQMLEVIAAGSSDWIIHSHKNTYHQDEKFFLHAIIEMVENELSREEWSCSSIQEWAHQRHQQAENGQLMFLASHLDFLVRASAGKFTSR